MNTGTSMDNKALKHLNKIAKRPTLNIEFQDLEYAVKDNGTKEGWRQILHSISGKFRCGELTAILGPSGAGKTTLLSILAGYLKSEVRGTIKFNDLPRNSAIFKKISSYIMEVDVVQSNLTVKEAMIYAAGFKLGSHIKHEDKVAVIVEVIDLLGLEKCVDTPSDNLSGGERKRLSIALELVNNPPIIFLDEPTTGLDNFAVKQCVDLLKKISKMGRTVVCTIHQPPASVFRFFDQVYVIADGYCVYNGSPNHLVPFMVSYGHSCPSNYTPADYMIELVHSQPSIITTFKEAIENGKLNATENIDDNSEAIAIQKCDTDFPTSFQVQFCLLLSRMFLQMKRNRIAFYIQFFYHLLAGLVIAAIFSKIGNDGTQTYPLIKYCVSCVVFFTYTYMMIPILLFPLELKVLQREYFNHWYGLKAYYSALTISTLPLLLMLTVMFSTIVYFLTDQPKEIYRFVGFCVIVTAVAYTSQGLGYLIGSFCSITKGSIVGSAVLIPLLMLALHGMDYKSQIEPFYKFIMELTFVRNGVVGLCNTIFYQRESLPCKDVYCHYANGEKLLRDVSIPVMDYKYQLGLILVFTVIFRIMGYISLKFRLNTESSFKLK